MSAGRLAALREGIRQGRYIAAGKEQARELNRRFMLDLIAAVELTGQPGAEHLAELAWERGHSSGLAAVVDEMASLREALEHLGNPQQVGPPHEFTVKLLSLLELDLVIAFERSEPGGQRRCIVCTIYGESEGKPAIEIVGHGEGLADALKAAALLLPSHAPGKERTMSLQGETLPPGERPPSPVEQPPLVIKACKADPIGREPIQSVILEVSTKIPPLNTSTASYRRDALNFFRGQAEKVLDVLVALPQGTLDQVLLLLLERRASLLVVPGIAPAALVPAAIPPAPPDGFRASVAVLFEEIGRERPGLQPVTVQSATQALWEGVRFALLDQAKGGTDVPA